jgi:hypothetical protein
MVLDGIISTIVGEQIAPTQGTEMVNPANSVKAKTSCHANTEPSVKACVETLHGASLTDEDKVRTLQKCNEPTGNELVACQMASSNKIDHWLRPHGRLHSFHEHQRHDRNGHPGAGFHTDTVFDRDPLRGKEKLPTISAMGLIKQSANSVNPKSFRYGNTEPSMNFNRFKACVENVHGSSPVDEDSFRTAKKFAEPTRNELVACSGKL